MLILSSFAVYLQSIRHPFMGIDDGPYVYQNPMVMQGLTFRGILWAFQSFHAGNWHPLSWISHMLDCQIYGLNPGLHHLTNLILHAANAALMYLLLKRMTFRVWRSALVAALFALHPLHVESVAWISERKDVLSTLFFLLTLWAYIRYVAAPSGLRYLPLAAALIAGLMSKPMLVTLPFLLLLLDFWPLGRLRLDPGKTLRASWKAVWPCAREKLPLFAIAAASSIVTYLAQVGSAAVTPFAQLTLPVRFANAITSYMTYIHWMIWPRDLGILYPYNAESAWGWRFTVSLMMLAGITVLVLKQARKRGFLVTGWFWYLGTLVPVIGLIQVGAQALADRYTYIPLTGLFVIIAWGLGEWADRRPRFRSAIVTVSALVLVLLGERAFVQVGFWRDNTTLYERTLAVSPNNPIILLNLGSEFAAQGKLDPAISTYEKALPLDRKSGRIHAALGTALAKRGDAEKAMQHLKEAIRLDPNLSSAYNSLGVLLISRQKLSDAILYLRDAVKVDPNNADARNSLGAALLFQGNTREAIEEFRAAIRIRPDFKDAQNNLKTALSSK